LAPGGPSPRAAEPVALDCDHDSLGYGQYAHHVDFHCFTNGDKVTANGHTTYTWTYLRDTTTGVSGWVADALLDGLGSGIAC
jgi:hypothetical protein